MHPRIRDELVQAADWLRMVGWCVGGAVLLGITAHITVETYHHKGWWGYLSISAWALSCLLRRLSKTDKTGAYIKINGGRAFVERAAEICRRAMREAT